ncbi:MAG: ferrochelatase [Dehalococcoidia bacterium]|jgi:ferrochelatase|nr:MAG: ferrochelatase [Dehalococcoidia bacterium]
MNAVLLIGYGGPTDPSHIRPFLEGIARGRPLSEERLAKVEAQYQAVGGFSPFNALTFGQAAALKRRLAELGFPLPVYAGMRSWHPFLRETLQQMRADGVRRAVGIVLAPQRSEESWDRYLRAAEEARLDGLPELVYVEPWHDRPEFVEAQADRVIEAAGYAPGHWPETSVLVFSAHSIPTRLAEECRYREEIAAGAEAVAARLGVGRWRVAYQSRSGDPRTPWLEPDVNDVIRDLAQQGVDEVILVPIGFVCDNVEVLYDLGIQARATALECGVRPVCASTVGEHPAFITLLADLACSKLASVPANVGVSTG